MLHRKLNIVRALDEDTRVSPSTSLLLHWARQCMFAKIIIRINFSLCNLTFPISRFKVDAYTKSILK